MGTRCGRRRHQRQRPALLARFGSATRQRRRTRYVRQNASQGELRSHGFFYKPDGQRLGPARPADQPARAAAGYRHLVEELRGDPLPAQQQRSTSTRSASSTRSRNSSINDGCRASCVDWYGNARPLFVRNRVFALLGYEIVEGRVDDVRIREARRINYSPRYARSYTDDD